MTSLDIYGVKTLQEFDENGGHLPLFLRQLMHDRDIDPTAVVLVADNARSTPDPELRRALSVPVILDGFLSRSAERANARWSANTGSLNLSGPATSTANVACDGIGKGKVKSQSIRNLLLRTKREEGLPLLRMQVLDLQPIASGVLEDFPFIPVREESLREDFDLHDINPSTDVCKKRDNCPIPQRSQGSPALPVRRRSVDEASTAKHEESAPMSTRRTSDSFQDARAIRALSNLSQPARSIMESETADWMLNKSARSVPPSPRKVQSCSSLGTVWHGSKLCKPHALIRDSTLDMNSTSVENANEQYALAPPPPPFTDALSFLEPSPTDVRVGLKDCRGHASKSAELENAKAFRLPDKLLYHEWTEGADVSNDGLLTDRERRSPSVANEKETKKDRGRRQVRSPESEKPRRGASTLGPFNTSPLCSPTNVDKITGNQFDDDMALNRSMHNFLRRQQQALPPSIPSRRDLF